MHGRFRGYVSILIALTLGLVLLFGFLSPMVFNLPKTPGFVESDVPFWLLLALGGLLLFLSQAPFKSHGTTFTLAGPVVIPIIAYADPILAGILVAIGTFSLQELKIPELRFSKTLFNRVDLFLAGFCASLVFHSMRGIVGGPWEALWLLFASVVYFVVNHLLYWLAVFMLGGTTPRSYSALLPALIQTTPMSTILGVLFILSLQSFGAAGIAIFVVLLAALNREASASLLNAKSFLQIVEAFVETLEAKDHYTRGHSERVAELVQKIAREMNLPRKTVQTFFEVAKLHDIGKIGVFEGILNKEKHLTEDEFEVVKQHPVIGARIVSRVDALSEFALIIRSHHERWDGRGYPEGLTGEAIPLGARIIAVADSFDAITSDRPYRRAMTYECAIEELLACANSQFDEKVVRAAVAVLRREKPSSLYSAESEAAAAGERAAETMQTPPG